MAITFQISESGLTLSGRNKLKLWIRKVLRHHGMKEGELNFLFTSDARVHEANLRFLHHDTFTDIITFDQTEGTRVSGDIMISVERVEENARLFRAAFEDELRRVMIHGILHLCGFSDKTEAEKSAMRKKEDEALALYASMP